MRNYSGGPLVSVFFYFASTKTNKKLYCYPLRFVERYDPKKNQWTFVSQMNNLRDGACVVSDGSSIFAITGFDGNCYLNTIEVYDPSEDTWKIEGTVNLVLSGI